MSSRSGLITFTHSNLLGINESIITSINWCNYNNYNYCSQIQNQYAYNNCGSCYISSSLATLASRLTIHYQHQHNTTLYTPIELSVQEILECNSELNLGNGCNGGDADDVYEYVYRYGIVSKSCNEYTGIDTTQCKLHTNHSVHHNHQYSRCQTCMPDDFITSPHKLTKYNQRHGIPQCKSVSHYDVYDIAAYYHVSGEEQMMIEIALNGPISCGIAADEQFTSFTHHNNIINYTNVNDMNHQVNVVGYGIEDSAKYWIIQNSFGMLCYVML